MIGRPRFQRTHFNPKRERLFKLRAERKGGPAPWRRGEKKLTLRGSALRGTRDSSLKKKQRKSKRIKTQRDSWLIWTKKP